MKKLYLFILIATLPLITKAQTDRWKLLYSDTTKKEKTYIDTSRITKLFYLDGHTHLLVIWLRTLSNPTQQGEYVQQADTKVVVDVPNSQLEYKSVLVKYNDKVTSQKQYDEMQWTDIFPETNEEILLNYCSNFLKSNN